MQIANNIPALNSQLSMRRADRGVMSAMNRLASGLRINSAREDAAGLAIANKLSMQVGGLNQASENSTHGISLIQTAEGALAEVHNMLQRMRELAVQAANDVLTPREKSHIQLEIDQLTAEIHQISTRTEFNRIRILGGEADRVTEIWGDVTPGTAGSGTLTRSVVTCVFISHTIPPGRLDFEIERAGTHANVPFTTPTPLTAQALPAGSSINVNGISVTVAQNETWGDFLYRFDEALSFGDVQRHDSHLVANIAGQAHSITIGGDAALLAALGLGGSIGTTVGEDALIRDGSVRLVDEEGRLVPGGDTLSVSTVGNQVFIRGTRGEDIRLNIQVNFDPASGDHYFADGTPADPRYMRMDIRSFGPLKLQVGPNHNNAMSVQIPRVNAETLGLVEHVGGLTRTRLNYRTQAGATRAIDITDNAISTVSSLRARLGAYQNRLESTVMNLDVAAENTEISRSRIIDTDVARESTRFAKYNVMFQAAMAMLGQANQRPQQILQLLM